MEFFELVGTRGFYRPVGQVTLDRGLAMIAESVRMARAQGAADLLVDTTGFTGYDFPGIFDRYTWATSLATLAGPSLRVATVLRADVYDPEKIGKLMAQNRGVSTDVFTNESEALAWLDARIVASRHPIQRHS